MRNLVTKISKFLLDEIYPALILLTFLLIAKMILTGAEAKILNQDILVPSSSLFSYLIRVYIISSLFGTIPLFSFYIFACICYTSLIKDKYILISLKTVDFFLETSLQKITPILIDISVIIIAALGLLTGITFYHYTFEWMFFGKGNSKYKKQIFRLFFLSFSLIVLFNYVFWGIGRVIL